MFELSDVTDGVRLRNRVLDVKGVSMELQSTKISRL